MKTINFICYNTTLHLSQQYIGNKMKICWNPSTLSSERENIVFAYLNLLGKGLYKHV